VARTLPRNDELADQFEQLADLLELDGTDAFRLQAYRRAAARIRESAVPVAQLALDGKATRLSGIGGTIQAKIAEYTTTGELAALEKVRAKIPEGLVDVMHVSGLGPKTARKLWQELGISTIEELRVAAEAERLRGVAGLGEKTEQKVLDYLARPTTNAATGRSLLGRALPFVQDVIEELRAHPASDRVSEAGSVRRRVETVKDLDVIATAVDAQALIDAFVSLPWVAEVTAKGGTKATVVSQDGLAFDLRVVPPDCYGNLLQHFTGSADHNVAVRQDAVGRGLSVSEYGIEVVETGELVRHGSEEELYAFLGYVWIPPELRENRGELDAARRGELPRLVELADLRGDLHVHTDWSDGRHTLQEMAAAAAALGHSYIAICDHARRLRDGRLEEQAQQIAELSGQIGGLEILSGVEVDIRADGSLDLPDAQLAERDWVMASIHSGFDRSREQLTSRLLAAIENPHVDCIGHPTGRKIGKRFPYDVDFEGIATRCAETGTFLELNSQPDRLDLTDTRARAAVEAGVRVVVSTDAHRTWELANIQLGVAQARRGWVSAGQVVNARPWPEVAAMLKAPKTQTP
jgi:DNA polymerase (family 10)